MKKSIYTFALLLIGAITIMSFSNKTTNFIEDKSVETNYYYFYNQNYTTHTLFISNVFASSEHPEGMEDYMVNELDYNLGNNNIISLQTNSTENYALDARSEDIRSVKDDNYKIIKFNVKCKNGRLYAH